MRTERQAPPRRRVPPQSRRPLDAAASSRNSAPDSDVARYADSALQRAPRRPHGAPGDRRTREVRGASQQHRRAALGARPTRKPRSAAALRRRPPQSPPRLGNPIRRLRFGLALLFALFIVLGGRLVYVQATDGSAYAAQALAERSANVTLAAERGSILDRDGAVLSRSVPASAIYVDPKFVKNPVKIAHRLSGMLGVPESELLPKLKQKRNKDGTAIRFVYLARGLDREVGQAVTDLALPGVYELDEQRRDVPGHDLAANIIGFTGTDGYGLAGLESSYDKVLAGKSGKREFERGASGQEIPNGYHRTTPAKPGSDVQLTIDSDLQYETQQVLTQHLQEVKAYDGAAVVLDAHTGEILSMASYPTYDAENPGGPAANRVDIASSTVIEPGSVHKAITLSAALNENVIQADSAIPVGPTINKGGTTFSDTHPHGQENITLQGIMAQSSNVGAITIADKLGAQKLYEYQKKFGIGDRPNIGLPGETNGIVQPPKNWSGPSYGGVPIGMGVAVTPLEMTAAYATIANDGRKVTPQLVHETKNAHGKVSKTAVPHQSRVVSAKTAKTMRETMEAVVSNEGTAKTAAVPGYRVSGKTGTGMQVVNGKYAEGNVTSFIGMIPAEAPRYVIGIFAHVPSHGEGGGVAGPVFADLAGFTMRHYSVPPATSEPPPIRITA